MMAGGHGVQSNREGIVRAAHMQEFSYYASSNPNRLNGIARYIFARTQRSLSSGRLG
jgi:hypothetical protein